jgi:hypothetical protein
MVSQLAFRMVSEEGSVAATVEALSRRRLSIERVITPDKKTLGSGVPKAV